MRKYTPGDRYKLTAQHGEEPEDPRVREGLSLGPALRQGEVGTVREVVAAHEKGAHSNLEDSVVMMFPQVGSSEPRATAFGLEEAESLLEPVE